MPERIAYPSAFAAGLVRHESVSPPSPVPTKHTAASRTAAVPASGNARPAPPIAMANIAVAAACALPARTALLVPIISSTGRSQVRGAFALLADPATRLHGCFIRYQGAWVCWRATEQMPLPEGTERDGMTVVGGPMPALLVQALADQVRIVTDDATVLLGMLERLGWPVPPLLAELGAVLRALNLPSDPVGMAVHLLKLPITPVRSALADHRWRDETVTAQGLRPVVERAWLAARIQGQVIAILGKSVVCEAVAWVVHERINRHGVLVDRVLASRCAAVAAPVRAAVLTQAQQHAGRSLTAKLLGDFGTVQGLLAPLGVEISSLSVPALERVLSQLPATLPQRVAAQWILAATIICHQVESERFAKMVSHLADDDVLRGSYVFCGASPGRWTSEGVQLQNLKRSTLPPVLAEQLIIAVHEGSTATTTSARALAGAIVGLAGPQHAHVCLSGLARLCLMAREGTAFAISDLSIIELRILNWLAGDDRVLAKLADPHHDAHTATAEVIWQEDLPKGHPAYDLRRNLVAKRVNHGFGFGLSADAAEKKAREDWGLDLKALNLSGLYLRDVYLRRFPRIQPLWNNLITSAVMALQDQRRIPVGPVSFAPGRFGLNAVLPSGRVMVYPNARVQRDKFGREGIVYSDYGDNGTIEERSLWGSKLAQHLCEAVGRDLLIAMMRAVLEAGYAIPLHSHDELVVEVPEADAARHLEVVQRIMSTTPAWASGLPLAADGHLSQRFSKGKLFMG